MVAGHLRERDGHYHIVLSYTDKNGKRHTPSKTTGLPVKGNKKRANEMLQKAIREKEEELRLELLAQNTEAEGIYETMTFTGFLSDWLAMMKGSVEITTFSAYQMAIKKKIIPYFDEHYPGLLLQKVTPKHIQDYYTYEMKHNGVSANTVKHRHANIHRALRYAFKTGLIDVNPADRVDLPKKDVFETEPYNEKEMMQLFEAVKDTPLELIVILTAFYGLRREEVLGLKWNAIDFDKRTITIKNVVTEAFLDGKCQLIEKNRTKTKSSFRTLPLVPQIESLLRHAKAQQEEYRELCGDCYKTEYLDFVNVNPLGTTQREQWHSVVNILRRMGGDMTAEAAAGYCAAEDYDRWFFEQEEQNT